jgi:hypothetical protein
MTTAHEIGHFLDWQGIPGGATDLGGPYRDYVNDPLFREWVDAIHQSPNYQQLLNQLSRYNRLTGHPDPAMRQWGRDMRSHAQYLLTYREFWARSYAQYIAHKSGDVTMRAELVDLRTLNPAYEFFPRQWEDADFLPIAAAIDRMFAQLGWTKPSASTNPTSNP